MKTVLCYGDSNTWGCVPMLDLDDNRRFGLDERWPGIVRARLGAGWHVIEEGLSGRTTCRDDPVEGADRNGLALLAAILQSHRPLDAVVLMLGTNDLKVRFGLDAAQIANGLHALAETVAANSRLDGTPPALLIVCPPPIIEVGCLQAMFIGGAEISRQMAPHYRRIAAQRGADFLDAGALIESSAVDGIHLDEPAHARLGEAVALRVAAI